MQEIYYIGGSPCCGKSTIAEMLAVSHALEYYKADDHLFDHMRLAAEDGKTHSKNTLTLSNEQIWIRNPHIQNDEEILIYNEIFQYTMQDICAIHTRKPIIAEGAGLMPELMTQIDIDKYRYICLVPIESFQRQKYAERTWIKEFLSGCDNQELAFDNWMSRDALFAKHVYCQAQRIGYSTIVVDGNRTIEDNYEVIAKHFGLLR